MHRVAHNRTPFPTLPMDYSSHPEVHFLSNLVRQHVSHLVLRYSQHPSIAMHDGIKMVD